MELLIFLGKSPYLSVLVGLHHGLDVTTNRPVVGVCTMLVKHCNTCVDHDALLLEKGEPNAHGEEDLNLSTCYNIDC